MKRRRLLILIVAFPVFHLAGQHFPENNFAHYTTAKGLSHNSITGITQDSAGYVWVATMSGLNRYNGSRFVQFHSNNDSTSLPAEELSAMSWIDKHRLAINSSGLHIVDTRTGKSRNLFIPYHVKQYQYKFNMIARVRGDEKGNVYVLTRSGFYHFDKDYQLVSRFDYYSDAELTTEHFFFGRDLFTLNDRHLLIVSIAGLYLYDKEKKQTMKMAARDYPLLAEFLDYPTAQYSFYQNKKGNLFVFKLAHDSVVYINTTLSKKVVSRVAINPLLDEFRYRSRMIPVNDSVFYLTGHFSGFFKMHFDPETGQVKLDTPKYFPSYLCSDLLTDRDNNLWVATNRGLFRQDPGRAQVQLTYLSDKLRDSFPDIRIDDVYAMGDKLYAAGRGRAGLLIFDKRTLRFEKQVIFKGYRGEERAEGNIIDAITSVDSTTLLLGTDWPLILYNTKNATHRQLKPDPWGSGDWTNDLFKDSKGNIWISAYYVHKYNPATKTFKILPHPPKILTVPFAIEEDMDGNIWMAGHGLVRYNTKLDSFDFLVDSFPFIKMADKQIGALVIDRQNTIWFNSNNNGLIGYDINTRTFRHFTRSHGLPDNNVASSVVVGNKLWLACYSGIACMDLKTSQIINFGKEDGFPEMPIVSGARFYYDSSLQQLYLGYAQGVVKFNPFDILRRRSSPNIFIENVAISGQDNYFLPGSVIKTSYRHNEIMITIGSVNFLDGNSQGFAYRIIKNNYTPWQQLGNQTSFNISNLSPGTYRIQVRGFSLNNRWPPQVKEITIVVSPPFWKSDWFVILLIAIIPVLIYLLVRWRANVARKKEMEKTKIQKLIADDYKNQFELEHISNYFSSSLAGKTTEEEVLWDVAGNLIGKMNYVDCMIYLWNEDKTKMIQKAAFGPKGKPEYISEQVFDVVPGQGIVGHVMQTQQPILVSDTRKEPRYRVDEQFRLSEVCVPIIHDDELMGIIDSEHHLPNYFKERDIKILTTIATLIGNKLKQIESEKSLVAKGKELANINEQLAEARLAALQAQMNPHFVFNALNSIKRMILDADNERASRYLSKFALMIRMTLNHSRDTFVTLDENIAYIKTYLEMEQLRFDDSFSYNIFIAENIDTSEITIPSMMIQPLVENAIWHGLLPSTNDKKIKIGFTQEYNKITCVIEDNGIGIKESAKLKEKNKAPHQSVGLENLQKRIKIINEKYETRCSLEIRDLTDIGKNGTGTRAVLKFHLINA